MTPGRELAALIPGTGMPTRTANFHFLWESCLRSGMPAMRVAAPCSPATASAIRSLHGSATSWHLSAKAAPIRGGIKWVAKACSFVRRATSTCIVGRPQLPALRPVSVCFFASPFDAPGDPPFGGSRERGGCAISMGEKKPQRPQWRHPPRRQRDVQRKCRSSSPRPNGDLAPALRLQRLSHFASKAQLRRCVGLKSEK